MKTTAIAAALLILGAAAPAPALALADSHMEKAPEQEAEKTAEQLTVNDPIEDLMADEKAAAVLLKHIPGINEHPAYEQFKGMSLVELKPWSAGVVTDEIIAAVTADLAALG